MKSEAAEAVIDLRSSPFRGASVFSTVNVATRTVSGAGGRDSVIETLSSDDDVDEEVEMEETKSLRTLSSAGPMSGAFFCFVL